MCNTAHVDPHGMHHISANSTSSPKQAKFWHRWPYPNHLLMPNDAE